MIERLGICSSWVSWKAFSKNAQKYIEGFSKTTQDALRYYVETGKNPPNPFTSPHAPVPDQAWEAIVNKLSIHATIMLFHAQEKAMRGETCTLLCAQAFTAQYIRLLIEVFIHERFPRRFNGRILKLLTLDSTMYIALGLIAGCEEKAVRFGRMFLEAYRRDFISIRDRFSIFHFILRLFVDWSGEEAPAWEEKPLQEPIMQALFEHWRDVDAENLVPYILAACDYHTHRSQSDNAKEMFEFSIGQWNHFPVEILMLYKLRESIGLTNPMVDHPLMNTPLGKLSPEAPCQPDELTAAVLARMKQDGFDEDAIYHSLCG